MSAHVATLYGANLSVLAVATAAPRSKTSGALDWPLRFSAAVISSALEASGWSLLTLMPYFSPNFVGPVRGQGDDVEFALGLGGGDQRVHTASLLR